MGVLSTVEGSELFRNTLFCAKIRAPVQPNAPYTLIGHICALRTRKKTIVCTLLGMYSCTLNSSHVIAIEIETAILVYQGYCIDIARE